MMDDLEIFRFLAAKSATGDVALVTVTRVSGSSMRNPGAHLAVAADGEWRGSLSGGCIEAAVVGEALSALAARAPREVRFGAGSPLIDIRLPCGGSLDVLINPIVDAALCRRGLTLMDERTPFALVLPFAGTAVRIAEGLVASRTDRSPAGFQVAHTPPLQVLILGHGASVEALEAQARAAGAVTQVMTPDRDIVARLSARGLPVTELRLPSDPLIPAIDPWTAIAFVFHDHDWETTLIAAALASPAFYVGAMGSRATHARRVSALEDAGVLRQDLARLRAPIGLIPSSRDPQVLALSALAEIIRDFGQLSDRPDMPLTAREPA